MLDELLEIELVLMKETELVQMMVTCWVMEKE
jgi:hypothetical protein